MLREYESPLLGDGTESSPTEPSICTVFNGTWGSRTGSTEGTLIVSADVTDEQHVAILAVDGESFGPAPEPVRTVDDIKKELVALDQAVVRPLHSHMAGRGTQEDLDKIEQLEDLKQALRAELAALEGGA